MQAKLSQRSERPVHLLPTLLALALGLFVMLALAVIAQQSTDVTRTVGTATGGAASATLSPPLRPGGKAGETQAEVDAYYRNLAAAAEAARIFGANPPASAVNLVAANPDLSAGGGHGAITVRPLPEAQSDGLADGVPTEAAGSLDEQGGEGEFAPVTPE
jgi:hypothetical protein